MLGNKIFYLDTKAEAVKEGIVSGVSVNEQGHKVYGILTKEGACIVHFARLCFENIADAEACLTEVIKLNEEIKRIQKEANEKIDALLLEIHGKPEYIHLTQTGKKEGAE